MMARRLTNCSSLFRALAGAVLLFALAAGPVRAAGDPIQGVWEQVDSDGDVGAWIALQEKGVAIEGTIVKLFPGLDDPADPVCGKCPGALRGKPILGLTIIRGLRRTGGTYGGGSILDPESGETYQLEATLGPDGQTLQVRAFKGVSLFGRTETWRRRQP